MVDWFWAIDTYRGHPDFERRFGGRAAQFFGLLVIGRRQFLTGHQVERLKRRHDRVQINSHKISCFTFDDLYDFLERRLTFIRQIADGQGN
jgi:hypothetical protein